ncbi:alkaline phosphatase family protein [uncultured Bacteroides sp.]|uniref:alkaline phosphatase family protein n=1 Tax=uncultured Bacteroides sp. TaxID=162156 RepID=UPI002AA85B6E|nr:alkaline phosphatase family protein [uncultured Bacteroides sp.]
MRGLLTSIITVLTFTGLQAQPQPTTPKLVVGLTVDQLRTDYIEAFSALYGEKGFKRLWKDGRVYRNAEFNFANPDKASSLASIYTGTVPTVNGITGESWLDISTLRVKSCVDDRNFMGNYTQETTSASQLMVSTVADELKVATQGKGLVYAIAPYREAAVFGAGHAGNGAFWLNDETGKWCGTTYYSDFPWFVSQYNDRKAIDFRINGMVWTPSRPVTDYKYLTSQWTQESFSYNFDEARKNKFRRLKTSPFINEEINYFLEDIFTNSTIGQDATPDLLALTYYAGNYDHKSTKECALEIQDTYVRLDKSIGELLDLLDKKVGLNNVLFCVNSTGYVDAEGTEPEKYRIPGGEFYMDRCAALLNMYLMAVYGEGKYVETHNDLQLYLNHKLIEKKQLNLNDVLDKASDFLIQFSGVKEVYTSHRLLLGAWAPEIQKKRNAYNRDRSGDLTLDILPGWTVINADSPSESYVVRNAYIPSPLVFLGGNVKPEIINTPVNIDCFAPTVARSMRIRAPNGCSSAPLANIFK